jgi:release factor glutamine methyltransferase
VSAQIDSSDVPALSVREILERGIRLLGESGIQDPQVDAELLVGHVLEASRGQIQAMAITGREVSVEEAAVIGEALLRRAAREPLQHISGIAYFRSLELRVGPGVFVPRPETEFVAGLAIDALQSFVLGISAAEGPIGIDLGTGSGAIALAMATEVPHARVIAVENSEAAFVWTRQNFESVNAENARLIFTDLAVAVPELDGSVSVVISNPPYIPLGAIPRDPEVRLFDPEHALYGGVDGLDIVRQVSRTGLRLLHSGGALILEHGELQGDAIRDLLVADGWRATATHRDLTGRDRATTAVR